MKYITESLANALYEARNTRELKKYLYVVTFNDDFGSHSRLLKSDNEVDKSMAKKFYAKYCDQNDCKFYSIELVTDPKSRIVRELISDKRVDSYI